MWILILTIVYYNYHGGGTAITQVGPFTTVESCLQAGNSYTQQNKDLYARALCVKKEN